MNADELVLYRRTKRDGVPEGDLRDPHVIANVLKLALGDHLDRLSAQATPADRHIYDDRMGKIVPTVPARPGPDPKEDRTACALASLIGYLEDVR